MKKLNSIFVLIFLFICCKNDTIVSNTEESKVILLYGQSNASGLSSVKYLKTYNEYDSYCFPNIYINYNVEDGKNISNGFVNTSLGQGITSEYFGPEIGIAKKLSQEILNENIYIIKCTFSGTNLDNEWLDGNYSRGIFYEKTMDFTLSSLNKLKETGIKPNIVAICWMQGESDASEGLQIKYYENTKSFVSLLRNDLKKYTNINKDFVFIDAKISKVWDNYELINLQKQLYANENKNTYLIDTISLGLTTNQEPYGNPDISHYDSISEIILGNAFAECIILDLTNNYIKQ